MITTSLTSKGQVTIPADLRAALGLVVGDQIAFQQEGNTLILKRHANDIKACFGVLKASRGVSLKDIEDAIEKGAVE